MSDKVTLATIASFQNDSSAIAAYNANSALITTAMDNTLSRDGTSPNQMSAPIDMNNQPIINLPAPSTMDSPLRLADINTVIGVIPTITVPGSLRYVLKNVNFNSANTDNTFAIAMPAGISRWKMFRATISNASASLTTATIGIFTGAGATGQTIAANQAITVATGAVNTNTNTQDLTLTNTSTEAYNVSSVFVRIGTAQGSAATADIILDVLPLT